MVPQDCRQVFFQAAYKDQHLLDDELTQQEEDIICGVYRVLSDTGSAGKPYNVSQNVTQDLEQLSRPEVQQRRRRVLVAKTRDVVSPVVRMEQGSMDMGQ